MGFKKGNFPCKYLGIELENGNKHNKVWSHILKRLDIRIGGWKDKWLTKVGKKPKLEQFCQLFQYILYLVFLSPNLLIKSRS